MRTIRLLYPDWLSGGLETYCFGANLLQHILPDNPNQPLVKVDIKAPDGSTREIEDGIVGKSEVLAGIQAAQEVIAQNHPDRIITLGGNCLVSQAPFDYLHGLYPNTGIIWIDAHPDVSMAKDDYPNAHAMVLGALLGKGEKALVDTLCNPPFKPNELLYVGLQGLHDYQAQFLDRLGVNYKIQTDDFVAIRKSKLLLNGLITSWCILILMFWIRKNSIRPILPTPNSSVMDPAVARCVWLNSVRFFKSSTKTQVLLE